MEGAKFTLISKIFGKRASPDANGSYGRGYRCWSAKSSHVETERNFFARTVLILKFDADYENIWQSPLVE